MRRNRVRTPAVHSSDEPIPSGVRDRDLQIPSQSILGLAVQKDQAIDRVVQRARPASRQRQSAHWEGWVQMIKDEVF